MKNLVMSLIGIALFVAGYQLTRRQVKYTTDQSALINKTSFAATPVMPPASLKTTMAFRLVANY